MNNKAVILLVDHNHNREMDIEVGLDISPIELFQGLNSALGWGEQADDPRNCYLAGENPICLLRGTRALKDFGIRDGSIIHYIRQER